MRVLGCTLLSAALMATPAFGQELAGPVEPARFNLDVFVGRLQGATELAHETRFEPSPAYGAAFMYWIEPGLGIGVQGVYSDLEVDTDYQLLSRQEPEVWMLGVDVAVRGRLNAVGRTFLPYLEAGAGTKRYEFDDAYYAPAVSLKAGVRAPLGPLGLFLEGGPVYSEMHNLGFWDDQVDGTYGGGVSIRFGGGEPAGAVAASG